MIEKGKSVLLIAGMIANIYTLEVEDGGLLDTASGAILIVANN